MMAVTWASGVNQKTYNYIQTSNMAIVQDDSDITGVYKMRLRSTRPAIVHKFYMKFSLVADSYALSEWNLFKTWVERNLAGGVLSFMFPNPVTGVSTEMQFVISDAGAAYEIQRFTVKDSVLIQVSMKEV